MNLYTDKKNDAGNRAIANDTAARYPMGKKVFQLTHALRPGNNQHPLQLLITSSPKIQQIKAVQRLADERKEKKLPVVQRMVDWREEEVATKNPIQVAMPPLDDWGFTHFVINGSEDQEKALNGAEFIVEKTKLGLTEIGVAKEPENYLGTRMEIPVDPPWTANVSKSKVGGTYFAEANERFNIDLTPYMNGVGNTALSVKGVPSDNTMVSHTQEHEQHHVNDDVRAREQIVDTWDNALYDMKQKRETFLGFNPVHALKRLYQKAGGTPGEIGSKYYNRVKELGIQYHNTEEGSKPPLANIVTSHDQSTIELHFKPH